MTNYTDDPDLYDNRMRLMSIDSSGDSDLIQCIKNLNPINLYEVGCGTGILTQKVAKLNFELIASDVNPSFLIQSKKRCSNVQFKLHDAVKTAIDENIDVVFCRFVYHHIKNEDKVKFLRNLGNARNIVILDYFIPEGDTGLRIFHDYRLNIFQGNDNLINLEKDTMHLAFKKEGEFKVSLNEFYEHLRKSGLTIKYHKLIEPQEIGNPELLGMHLFVLGGKKNV